MPVILELRETDGKLWACIPKSEDGEPVHLWTEDEMERRMRQVREDCIAAIRGHAG